MKRSETGELVPSFRVGDVVRIVSPFRPAIDGSIHTVERDPLVSKSYIDDTRQDHYLLSGIHTGEVFSGSPEHDQHLVIVEPT